MRKTLAIILCLLMVFTMIPSMSLAGVDPEGAVCRMDMVDYDSLGEAFESLSANNESITLLRDIVLTEPTTINNYYDDIVFDLGNYKITGALDTMFDLTGAGITIKGNGKESAGIYNASTNPSSVMVNLGCSTPVTFSGLSLIASTGDAIHFDSPTIVNLEDVALTGSSVITGNMSNVDIGGGTNLVFNSSITSQAITNCDLTVGTQVFTLLNNITFDNCALDTDCFVSCDLLENGKDVIFKNCHIYNADNLVTKLPKHLLGEGNLLAEDPGESVKCLEGVAVVANPDPVTKGDFPYVTEKKVTKITVTTDSNTIEYGVNYRNCCFGTYSLTGFSEGSSVSITDILDSEDNSVKGLFPLELEDNMVIVNTENCGLDAGTYKVELTAVDAVDSTIVKKGYLPFTITPFNLNDAFVASYYVCIDDDNSQVYAVGSTLNVLFVSYVQATPTAILTADDVSFTWGYLDTDGETKIPLGCTADSYVADSSSVIGKTIYCEITGKEGSNYSGTMVVKAAGPIQKLDYSNLVPNPTSVISYNYAMGWIVYDSTEYCVYDKSQAEPVKVGEYTDVTKYAGKPLYVKYIETAVHTASAEVSFTAPLTPEGPTGLIAKKETYKGSGDATVTGVTSSMDIEFCPPGVENVWNTFEDDPVLIDGVYTNFRADALRFRYKGSNESRTLPSKWTVFDREDFLGEPMVISFDANGGEGGPTGEHDVAYGDTLSNIFDYNVKPTKEGYIFTGWYEDKSLVKRFNIDNGDYIFLSPMTLYAKWTQDVAPLSGYVCDEADPSTFLNGIIVELWDGPTKVSTDVSDVGHFAFADIPYGTYKLRLTDPSTTYGYAEIVVTVPASANTVGIVNMNKERSWATICSDNVNVLVDDIFNVAKAVGTVDVGDKVQVDIHISGETEASVPPDDAAKIKTAVGSGKTTEYLDIHIDKTVNAGLPQRLSDVPVLIKFVVDYDLTGKSNVNVYRRHGDNPTAEKFGIGLSNANADGEYVELDTANNKIILHVKKFSTYAISYDNAAKPKETRGGKTSVAYKIIIGSHEHGNIVVDQSSVAGKVITVTALPEEGYALDKIVVTDAKNNAVAVTGNTFSMPSSNVEVAATFVKIDNTKANDFVDVPNTAYYKDAVEWAVENGITNGLDAMHFGPNVGTTRAQMVTFLWRAMGSPEPTTTKIQFEDVKSSDYFTKAVMWATENGIVKGISEKQFAPNAIVTRCQAVSFLYRLSGTSKQLEVNPFTDVKDGAYYKDAVLWAADNNITSGVTTTEFAPNEDCSRSQVVTFLYRNK